VLWLQKPWPGPPQRLSHEALVHVVTEEAFTGKPSMATKPVPRANVRTNFRIFIELRLSCHRSLSGG
jgi:hypothetical protein